MTERIQAQDQAFETRVRLRCQHFELLPLIRLLKRRGYHEQEIFLESYPDGDSGPALVRAVEFQPGPPRRVTIALNMGLLGSSSPLPSYFFRLMQGAAEPEPFEHFMHYFDNVLLRGLAKRLVPEEDEALWGPAGAMKASCFGMVGPASVATLAQVVAWMYPELPTRVRRRGFQRSTAAHACRTGISHLDGSGVVGRNYRFDAEGFAIDLYAEEEQDDAGREWAQLVRERLDRQLLPLLRGYEFSIHVVLHVDAHGRWALLRHGGHLGFERVRAKKPGAHRLVIYSGLTGQRTTKAGLSLEGEHVPA